MGLMKGQINWSLYLNRLKLYGRMHHIPELIRFYNQNGLKACFFFGMDNAIRLSYNYQDTRPWIRLVLENGHEAGVHGMETRNLLGIAKEHARFKQISGLDQFGIRTHYLRLSGYAHELFAQVGYTFDSSMQGIFEPFKVGPLWEIPISIMDASLVPRSQLNQDLNLWKKNTIMTLNRAIGNNQSVFVINFHDLFFDSARFPIIVEWFKWLIEYLIENKFEFCTFKTISL